MTSIVSFFVYVRYIAHAITFNSMSYTSYPCGDIVKLFRINRHFLNRAYTTKTSATTLITSMRIHRSDALQFIEKKPMCAYERNDQGEFYKLEENW
ncbi:hypothetical protein [Bacillus sp. Bos-x628]|uniref:hypothetical protein n=1 Tax=Bacillus maqinnsis TaxID=3229854 RepID=UPI00338DD683